ncbi:uncharacterized protein [Solanum tuberosum]|uniref:uncharacterized protein n=1 Tax=Solanum tuberosum TaxID=4113 RepID=UPI00073A4E61|nr:PREDICTED: uncharacterized protein LOC107057984 [Solanum tuberosum]
MTSPDIQKDIVNSCAKETVKAIIEDLNGDYFGILVDESKDVSHKEQMSLVLRYVNKKGSGLNQELGLQKPGDTRWRSHFKTVHNFISLFSSIVYVLEVLENEGILEITYDLNMALQQKDQDIVTAMKLVDLAKKQLQSMRESKWNYLVEDICLFCEQNDIMIPKMDEKYGLGKSKRKSSSVTYSHHLCVEVFYAVIDLQLLELNNSFNVVSIDILLGMDSLSPENSFINYDKKIMKLATYYPNEFDASKIEEISFDLDTYIYYVSKVDNAFSNLKGLGDLSMALVKTNMHKTRGLVYLL